MLKHRPLHSPTFLRLCSPCPDSSLSVAVLALSLWSPPEKTSAHVVHPSWSPHASSHVGITPSRDPLPPSLPCTQLTPTTATDTRGQSTQSHTSYTRASPRLRSSRRPARRRVAFDGPPAAVGFSFFRLLIPSALLSASHGQRGTPPLLSSPDHPPNPREAGVQIFSPAVQIPGPSRRRLKNLQQRRGKAPKAFGLFFFPSFVLEWHSRTGSFRGWICSCFPLKRRLIGLLYW